MDSGGASNPITADAPIAFKVSMTCGIYWIYQISRDRAVYVGSSNSIERRFTYHKSLLTRGRHRNRKLLNTWNKYGAEDFVFAVLEEVGAANLTEREQFWMDAMPDWPSCCIELATKNFARGSKMSEELKEKLRIRNMGNKYSLGRKMGPYSEEWKRKQREAHLGKSPTEETRKKQSDAMRGRKQSAEHIAKAAAARRGWVHTDEQKAKWSEQRKGRPWSDARRQAQANKKASAEG